MNSTVYRLEALGVLYSARSVLFYTGVNAEMFSLGDASLATPEHNLLGIEIALKMLPLFARIDNCVALVEHVKVGAELVDQTRALYNEAVDLNNTMADLAAVTNPGIPIVHNGVEQEYAEDAEDLFSDLEDAREAMHAAKTKHGAAGLVEVAAGWKLVYGPSLSVLQAAHHLDYFTGGYNS